METILIVEDDQSTQKALKRLFESEGYAVQIRGDGKSALQAFHAAAPTAIILDLRLPIVSGKTSVVRLGNNHLNRPSLFLVRRRRKRIRSCYWNWGRMIM
jgi:DNA-binding response OmpR family regulator